MRALTIDTEFTWLPGFERFDDKGERRVPHPPNACIESIAYVSIVAGPTTPLSVAIGTIAAATEAERVAGFLARWEKTKPEIVTFGGRQADIPLITARCLAHRIPARDWLRQIAFAKRYSGAHVDIYDELGGYGAQRYGGLDDWARCVGWPGKGDVTGADVGTLIERGERAKVDAYCLADAVQSAAVFLRLCLAKGRIDDGQYLMAARELLRVARADERVSDVAMQVNELAWLGPVSEAA